MDKVYSLVYKGIFNNVYVMAKNATEAEQKCINAGYGKPLQAIEQNGISLHYIKIDIN